MKPEDLLVERVLVSVYPEKNTAARECAKMLISVILREELEIDWSEVERVANLSEYRNFTECTTLVREVADELKIKNPLHSN